MIRKPTEAEFRDSMFVRAVRLTRRIAVEGGRCLAWCIVAIHFGLYGLIFAGSLIWLFGVSVEGWFVAGAILGLGILYWFRSAKKLAASYAAAATMGRVGRPGELSGAFKLDIAIVVRKVVTLTVLGWFVLAGAARWSPLVVIGVLVAFLIVQIARIFGDRTVLKYDEQGVAVRGPFGVSSLRWVDVEGVDLKRSWLSAMIHLSSRFVMITASPGRAAGPAKLLVPIDLLNLDHERMVRLVGHLIQCQALGGAAEVGLQPDDARATTAANDSVNGVIDRLPAVGRSFGTRRPTEDGALSHFCQTEQPLPRLQPVRQFGRRRSLN